MQVITHIQEVGLALRFFEHTIQLLADGSIEILSKNAVGLIYMATSMAPQSIIQTERCVLMVMVLRASFSHDSRRLHEAQR